MVIGDVLPVVGRVREEPPASVTVRGTVAGRPFERSVALTTQPTEEASDLRLRWAGERLRQLLLDGGGREEVAELGTRYGLITPFTSYYVPSAQELAQMGRSASRWIARPDLLAETEHDRAGDTWLAIALGPLSIAGCSRASDAPAEEEAPEWMQHAADEGAMGGSGSRARSSWYGIEGDEPAAQNEAPVAAAAEAEPPPPPAEPMPTPTTTAAPAAPMPSRAAPVEAPVGGAIAPNGALMAPPMQPMLAPPMPEAQRAASTADARDRSNAGFGFGRGGGGGGASRHARAPADIDALLDDALGGEIASRGDGEALRERAAAPDPGFARSVTVTIPVSAAEGHARTRCSDAAGLSLDDRSALWGERLGQAGGPSGWVDVYRRAVRDCEAPTWRDRRALLGLILGQAGSIEHMLSVYRLFDSGSARGFLRAAILRRVRSPQDLRAVRGAFGLGQEPDWELVEQILARANGAEARLRALRRLSMQYPDSFDLKLRLLEMLETSGHDEEARRLADALRADARSDAGVRTAVGEMYLRMERTDEARRVFSEIVEFAPLDELARRRLGDLYRAHGWFEDAYRQYQTLASIRPDDPSVLLLLAQAAAGAGRVDEALRLEQRLMETAQPGAEAGIARIAQLWSSVRLAKLRAAARESEDEERLEALDQRMRRSGVLAGASELRVTLVWSHPDAQIALYAAHPSAALARPMEIAPEHGIEAFDVPEEEGGVYRIEVRRADPDSPTEMHAELVTVWHEGRDDEVVRVIPLSFTDHRERYAWELEGNELREAAN